MYDPIMRVLTVLEVLQARDHVTGAELAERLEVDLRTVQRYIVRLKDLKIPVESSRGVGGAYRLRPGYRLPPLLLTNEEAFALSLGLHSLRQVGLSAFAPATEGALKKLGRVLPEALRESIRTVEDVVAIEPGPWVVTTSVEHLIRAASAIRTGRRIRFDYRSHDGNCHAPPHRAIRRDAHRRALVSDRLLSFATGAAHVPAGSRGEPRVRRRKLSPACRISMRGSTCTPACRSFSRNIKLMCGSTCRSRRRGRALRRGEWPSRRRTAERACAAGATGWR